MTQGEDKGISMSTHGPEAFPGPSWASFERKVGLILWRMKLILYQPSITLSSK